MVFDTTISLGNVISLAGVVFMFWRFQVSSIERQNKFHVDNVVRLTRLETQVKILLARNRIISTNDTDNDL